LYIAVVGTGYVGLVAGTCFAETGNDVICVDIDEAKVESLNKGRAPIYEPGLEELVKRNLEEGRLLFSTNLPAAVRRSKVIFIAVNTPPGEDGSADLTHVLDAARSLGKAMNGYKVIVEKSTVPVGTAQKIRQIIMDESNEPFDVVSNPEFLKEGAAVEDFLKPDRVVVGADSEQAAEIMKELYAPFVRNENPILIMDIASAETTKYVANAMLATKISFINEMALICDKVGASIDQVRRGIGFDSRIGFKFLFPGVGYGGSCFPKDVKALIRTAEDVGVETKMLKAVDEVNERQKRFMVEKILGHFNGDIKGRRFAVWGLSFKPRTNDMREAPAITIINSLLEKGATVRAFDPEAMEEARKIFGGKIEYAENGYDALNEADGLIVITEWNEFRRPNFERVRSLMKQPVIFDGRNLYEPEMMIRSGLSYYGVGRGHRNE